MAFMASTMSRQWRSSLASHLYTVTQPWPNRNLAQEANQLVKQCAGKWGLALPPTPEAAQVAPTQVHLSILSCNSSSCNVLMVQTMCRRIHCVALWFVKFSLARMLLLACTRTTLLPICDSCLLRELPASCWHIVSVSPHNVVIR